jgi:hypothetical protein
MRQARRISIHSLSGRQSSFVISRTPTRRRSPSWKLGSTKPYRVWRWTWNRSVLFPLEPSSPLFDLPLPSRSCFLTIVFSSNICFDSSPSSAFSSATTTYPLSTRSVPSKPSLSCASTVPSPPSSLISARCKPRSSSIPRRRVGGSSYRIGGIGKGQRRCLRGRM